MAISPQPPKASVHSRLPTDAPPSLRPLAGRGSHETTPVRRAKAAASGPAAERDLAPGARGSVGPHLPPRPRRQRPSPARSTTGSRCRPPGSRRLRLLQQSAPSGRPRPAPPPSIRPPARARPSPAMARAGRAQLSAADRGAPSAQPRPPPPLPLPPPPPPPGREFFPFSKWRPMPVAPPDDVIPLRLLRRSVPRGLPGAHRAPTESARAVSRLNLRSRCCPWKECLGIVCQQRYRRPSRIVLRAKTRRPLRS